MKTYMFALLISLFILTVPAIAAQTPNLYPFKQNGKIGFIDKTGKVIIEPLKLEGWGMFHEGLNKVKMNGKWGFIDTSGKIAVEPKFEEAFNFMPDNKAPVKENGKWGFIDRTGKWVIAPQYDNIKMINPFNITKAYILTKGGKDGIIIPGKVIEPVYDKITGYGFISNDDNYEYIRIEKKTDTKTTLIGYLNIVSGAAIAPQFAEARDFSEGLAIAAKEKNGKYGVIDKTGRWVIEPQFTGMKYFADGLAPAKDMNGKWGFIDKSGKWVIAPQFAEAYNFSQGLAAVKEEKDKKVGFIDKTGRWVITPRYTAVILPAGVNGKLKVGFNENGLAVVHVDKKGWGVINKKGEFVVNPAFDGASIINGEVINVGRPDFFSFLFTKKESYIEGIADLNGKFIKMNMQLAPVYI